MAWCMGGMVWEEWFGVEMFFCSCNDEFLGILSRSRILSMRAFMWDIVGSSHGFFLLFCMFSVLHTKHFFFQWDLSRGKKWNNFWCTEVVIFYFILYGLFWELSILHAYLWMVKLLWKRFDNIFFFSQFFFIFAGVFCCSFISGIRKKKFPSQNFINFPIYVLF